MRPHPKELRHDEELLQILLGLYGLPPDQVWQLRIRPFLEANSEALKVLYEEHEALPEAELLDLVEAPMILELLEEDSARLARVWPGPASTLLRLANAAGRPIAHYA
jgi:hypothetical protein